ncbi:hypothetical protein DKT68_16070 [Micromonospora acroterricola]|uniref:Uncharacterized protein n=1 Tax=Micromonospora acroterricola TaxID=2202421 RepID=A0A317D3H9_9ACTN|nr:hypothetical protein [Micromonospora acroterricola]PWR08356.1 hypothetical protein DKT68_16070 [Micromonospora acroterricola]
MTTVLVFLVASVVMMVGVVVFVGWRDRNRFSSDEDSTAARRASADQHRHEAERHSASGMSVSNHKPST